MVGLIPLFAVETLDQSLLDELPDFAGRLHWFLESPARPCAAGLALAGAGHGRTPAALAAARSSHEAVADADAGRDRVPLGLRHPCPVHAIIETNPYVFDVMGMPLTVKYQPAESDSGLFGGNSNWRGPIWFPVNYLLIESLQKFHHYYGDDFKVECPTGSGHFMTLAEVADELTRRLSPDLPARRRRDDGRCLATTRSCKTDPHFRDLRAVPRVLPRRHRPRRGRLAPDRLDRPDRQAAPCRGRCRRRVRSDQPADSKNADVREELKQPAREAAMPRGDDTTPDTQAARGAAGTGHRRQFGNRSGHRPGPG